MRPLRCNPDPERQRQSAEALADATIYPAETRAGQEAMMVRAMSQAQQAMARRIDKENKMAEQDVSGALDKYTRKDNREEAQWPDEAFQKAKTWADWLDSNSSKPFWSTERFLYDEVRAEERRREPKVCGARSEPNEYGVTSVCQVNGPHKRHRETLTTPTGNATTYWYGPQCERLHLTEAAQRVIQAAGRLQSAMHNRACGPTPEMTDSCRCGLTKLRETMSQFYREAQS